MQELYNRSVIDAAIGGDLDVIAQCIGCFGDVENGFTEQMVDIFSTNTFPLELDLHGNIGDVDKLGRIEFKKRPRKVRGEVWVVNMYGYYKQDMMGPYGIVLDYDALRLCLRKLNREFPNTTVGFPGLIGCGSKGGDSIIVRQIIRDECATVKAQIFNVNI